MPRHARTWVVVMSLTFALTQSACVSVAPPSDAATLAPSRFVEKFNLSGRLSVRVAERLDSARFTWERAGAGNETLKFFTPFGSQIAEVVAATGRATLTRGKEVESAASETELIERVLGVRLSTTEIARWLQGVGLDAPGAALDATSAALDATSAAPRAEWKIVAENFTLRDGAKIASRITATRGVGADEISVRLVIDEFHAP